MTKIAYISVGSGGSDVALLSLLENIHTIDIEPLVIVNNWGQNNGLINKLEEKNIAYYRVNYGFSMWSKRSLHRTIIHFLYNLYRSIVINKISEIKLRKVIKEFNADIIHSNSSFLQIGYNVAKYLDIPHIWHIREFHDLHFNLTPIPTRLAFNKKIRSENNYNIAITKCVYDHFRLDKHSSILYDGVYSENYEPPINKREKKFLFVGQVTPDKGIFELIDAFIQFASYDSNYMLYIVGHYIPSVKRQIETRLGNVSSRVIFLGIRHDISNLMSKASSLIVSSKHEAFGLTTAEAMFNKCLVIGNNTGGTKEQFDNGYNLFGQEIGIRYTNKEDLIKAMKDVAKLGYSHYNQMLDRAYITVNKLYTKEKNISSLSEIYNKILKK